MKQYGSVRFVTDSKLWHVGDKSRPVVGGQFLACSEWEWAGSRGTIGAVVNGKCIVFFFTSRIAHK
jgi:hypothetical protein